MEEEDDRAENGTDEDNEGDVGVTNEDADSDVEEKAEEDETDDLRET